jgi:lipopolysaccharide export system protein LptA
MDVGNSQWVLTGHVRADMEDGQLRCDTATIRIVDNRIASINAHGGPALFQRPATNPPVPPSGARPPHAAAAPKSDMANVTVRGHAQAILYDAVHGQVQFSGDSWFTDGCNEITSELMTYNMTTQIVQAGTAPGSNARVHGTIRNTHPGTPCSAATPSPAASSGAAGTVHP